MARAGEFLLAVLLVLLSLPLWILLLLLIVVLSPGPPFFVHCRVGKDGKLFGLVKFRTMRHHAGGGNLTVGADARVTEIGRVLRRLKLDELPQLLNILRGEMTFVGPRPESEEYVTAYTPEQRRILDYKPGVTDPASLKFRYEAELLASATDPQTTYHKKILPEKIEISLRYQQRRTFWSDLGVILKTVMAVFQRQPR